MSRPNQEGTLYQVTLELFRQASLMQVHQETRLPYYWLRRLREGKIKDPSVNRMQLLYEHLTKKPLVVNTH